MSATDWNEVAVHSLLADVDLILKFFNTEAATDGAEARWLTVQQAQSAYCDFQKRRANLKLTPADDAELQGKLDRLRSLLRFFGAAA
jgi:hypothetical protein